MIVARRPSTSPLASISVQPFLMSEGLAEKVLMCVPLEGRAVCHAARLGQRKIYEIIQYVTGSGIILPLSLARHIGAGAGSREGAVRIAVAAIGPDDPNGNIAGMEDRRAVAGILLRQILHHVVGIAE